MARQKREVGHSAPKSVGVLFSGGLDSAALVGHYLDKGWQVWPVYVRFDLRWESIEIAWGQKFLRESATPLLQALGVATLNLEQAYDENWSRTGRIPGAQSKDDDVFLPARNLLLLTKAMLILSAHGVRDVALATLKGNPFADATPSYFRLLEKVLASGFGHPVRIHAPFREKTKAEIIRAYRSYPLHHSVSCINPKESVHCGLCNKCAERKRAFKKAGVKDLTVYADGSRMTAPAALS